MVSHQTPVVLPPCSNIESITPANLLKFYLKPVYEAQYHFQVHERALRKKMKEFKMHFKDFFAHIQSKNIKLSKDDIQVYAGKPIWEAAYHLQVTESSLRSRVKALKLGLWRSSSASASLSGSVSASAYAYANPKDLLHSLLEGKGWNYGIVQNLKRKAVVEDDLDLVPGRKKTVVFDEELEFKVVHNGEMSAFKISKNGISFKKVQQSVAEALTLEIGAFSLQYLDEDDDEWLILKNDFNLKMCIQYLQGRVKVRLLAKSNMT